MHACPLNVVRLSPQRVLLEQSCVTAHVVKQALQPSCLLHLQRVCPFCNSALKLSVIEYLAVDIK